MAIVVPALLVAVGVGAATTAATLSFAPKLLGPAEGPTLGPGTCGAYWYRGYAIMPYEVGGRRWGWTVRGGNGEDVVSHSVAAGSRDAAIAAAKEALAKKVPADDLWHTGLYRPKNAERALRVWGEGFMPEDVSAYFCRKPSSNWIWVSSDCSMVIEGPYFEPLSLELDLDAELATSVKAASKVSPTNSVYGYIDWLLEQKKTDTVSIVNAIASELRCAPNWEKDEPNEGSDRWFWDLVDRINVYVEEAGGIPFDPLGST
jgi:hypothetical protein